MSVSSEVVQWLFSVKSRSQGHRPPDDEAECCDVVVEDSVRAAAVDSNDLFVGTQLLDRRGVGNIAVERGYALAILVVESEGKNVAPISAIPFLDPDLCNLSVRVKGHALPNAPARVQSLECWTLHAVGKSDLHAAQGIVDFRRNTDIE